MTVPDYPNNDKPEGCVCIWKSQTWLPKYGLTIMKPWLRVTTNPKCPVHGDFSGFKGD